MYKVVFIRADFQPIGEMRDVEVPTGEKKTNFLGHEKDVTTTESKWVQTDVSDCRIAGPQLAADLETALGQLAAEGYEVVSVTPVTSGSHCNGTDTMGLGGLYGYAYGYSFTEGLVVVGKKIQA